MIKSIGFRPIIFSVNCFLATILTLFIAFSLDLKSPAWAMTTVYLTSQPLSGVMRAKAVYRVAGTLIGGIAMIAIVPNLVNAPVLTTAAIILWVALCIYISLLDRTPRAYMFALSGYTAALIGFPSVLAPGTVFDTAVSRMEEITIGVVCAAVVHSLIFPKSALSAFEAKLKALLADARGWIADALTKEPTPEIDQERRRIAADVTEIYLLGTSLRFDTSPTHPDINTIRAFDRRIVALLPLLSAVEDRLVLLRQSGPLPENLARLVSDTHDWIQGQTRGDRPHAEELRRACIAVTPEIGPHSNWRDLVIVNLTARLDELIESWQDCLDLADYIADPTQSAKRGYHPAPTPFAVKSLHNDPGIALLSALAAGVAMSVCSFFWIETAWPEGASAVAFAAVVCTLFAALDDPTSTIRKLTLFLGLCIPLVTIYQFFVLPAIDGFTLLAAVLGIVLIPAGIALAIPAYAVIGLALAVGFCVELGLQSSYATDLATLLNSNSAFVVGSVVALVVTGMIRVIGVQTSARRLIRAGLLDLADVADRRRPSTRDDWVSRMLDRVGLLLFRRPGFTARPQHAFADALGDLRLGVNVIELQQVESDLTPAGQTVVAKMFDEIAGYFRGLAAGSVTPLGQELLQQIDFSISEVLARSDVSHSGLAAIVGLRRSLYPDAPPYREPVVAAPSTLSDGQAAGTTGTTP
jgi:uncharacterized membrane protein YccC